MELSRRKFLTMVGLSGVGIGLAACSPSATPTPMPTMDMGGSTSGTPSADDMDAMMETGVKTFLDAFLGMYTQFLKERKDPKAWATTQKQIHRWVTERAARR